MNFEELIYPLTELLIDNHFSVTNKSPHLIEYSSNFATIRIAYANLEKLFYTYVGQNPTSLIELTPTSAKEVFNDNRFQFQSTLTIDNLISFLQGNGKAILSGDKNAFIKLNEFSERQSKEYTRRIIQSQNIQSADEAWIQKDYVNFVRFIDKTEKHLLPESYLKKYKIALGKLQQ
jgi:hypothetical protein